MWCKINFLTLESVLYTHESVFMPSILSNIVCASSACVFICHHKSLAAMRENVYIFSSRAPSGEIDNLHKYVCT